MFIIEFNSFSKRICLLYNNLTFIQVHAPDTSYPDNEVEKFYDSVQRRVNIIPKRDELVVMGDFIAKGGIDQKEVKTTKTSLVNTVIPVVDIIKEESV